MRSPLCPSPNGFSPVARAAHHHSRRGTTMRVGIGAGQHVGADLDRLGPLGVVAQRHARHAQAAGLLLQAARVGERERGAAWRPRKSR